MKVTEKVVIEEVVIEEVELEVEEAVVVEEIEELVKRLKNKQLKAFNKND